MISYNLKRLENGVIYKVEMLEDVPEQRKTFERTVKNLNSMLVEGRKVILVSPERSLSEKEKEEYRVFFCKKAKEEKVNFVYFTVPVNVEVSNPLVGTMFE